MPLVFLCTTNSQNSSQAATNLWGLSCALPDLLIRVNSRYSRHSRLTCLPLRSLRSLRLSLWLRLGCAVVQQCRSREHNDGDSSERTAIADLSMTRDAQFHRLAGNGLQIMGK